MSDHAKFSPSRMERIVTCPGSIVLEGREADKTSKYAAEGNAAHDVAELVLIDRIAGKATVAAAFIGRVFEQDGFSFTVDEDMAGHVQDYVDGIEQMVGVFDPETCFVEQRVYHHRFAGCDKEEGFGTSDFIFLDYAAKTIRIRDLKYGMGVRVYAEENTQGMTYGLGTYDRYRLVEDWDAVEISIHQPRLDHLDTWECSLARLMEFADELRAAVNRVREAEAVLDGDYTGFLKASEKGCKFCRAKANCFELRSVVADIVTGSAALTDFDDLDTATAAVVTAACLRDFPPEDTYLGVAMDMVPLVEIWCLAVRAETERRIFAGETVESPLGGYGLDEGKRGNRDWIDKEAAEARLKSARLRHEEMFDYKLISPTTAEKRLAKEKPRVWSSLADLIGQKAGKPTVKLRSHIKKPISVSAIVDDFSDLTGDGQAHPFGRD